MRYFTADLHLGHRAIIDHCCRPFRNANDMDDALIGGINDMVGRSDMLYIVGDFCLGGVEAVLEYRSRIKCHSVFLIRGNHDRLSAEQYDRAGLIFKGDISEIKIEDQHIVMCHYAMRRWNRSHRGSWCLFGHSHGHLPDDPKLLSIDVGVDCHSFCPLSFEEIRSIMDSRSEAVAQPNHPAYPMEEIEG